MAQDTTQIQVEVMQERQTPVGRWNPRVGNEITSLGLPQEGRDRIIQEAVNILSRCIPPTQASGQETGLVIGYVQSGKTMSFTAVTALAHDNGYKMVIIVAGTSNFLVGQSRDRIIKDLRLQNRTERRPWRHFPDPNLQQNSHLIIRDVLDEWNDEYVPPVERRSILITVMKHHLHLQYLIEVLSRIDLNGVPTLIIDDEGDQAGLNTQVRSGSQSPTYGRLLRLKEAIPHHSFLQYTATPQAPLLINIVDLLSPSFVEVITPGDGYTGGREFFTGENILVRVIPENDIPTEINRINEPPQSLLHAMRLFFLGTAAHIVSNDPFPNRSMMVHPSQLIYRHGQYCDWVRRARDEWMRILKLQNDSDHVDLISIFARDYQDLQSTVNGIPSFEELQPRLLPALRRTEINEVNSRSQVSAINWNDSPYRVLVGGKALDRGYTVEGLTVTYMPRGPGVRNADTIQQRGRFFGYKRNYQGYCRIFLEANVNDAFRYYVEHEEDVRTQLMAFRNSGRPLHEWRREFFLTRNLNPTRRNVYDIDFDRVPIGDEWLYPEGPHDTPEVIDANRVIFSNFRQSVQFLQHDGLDLRSTEDKNLIARNVPLSHAHEELLTRFRVRRIKDSRVMTALLHLIQSRLFNQPNDVCDVFFMGSGRIIRRAYENDKIKQLFQGIQYRGGREEVTYPGDRAIKSDTVITVQMRYLILGELHQTPIAENVPHIAVWVPASIARDVLQQPQGG